MEEEHSCNNGRKCNHAQECIKDDEEDTDKEKSLEEGNNIMIYLHNNSLMTENGGWGKKKSRGTQWN